jgi:hypothetical protein
MKHTLTLWLAISLTLTAFWLLCRPTIWTTDGLRGISLRLPSCGIVSVIDGRGFNAICVYDSANTCVWEIVK